jgi:membrane protein involved in colicin uptake
MKKVFEQNPKLKKYYGTSDGEAFYQENDAKNHAKSLKDKTVECVENENFLEVIDSEELSDEQKEAAAFDAEQQAEVDKKEKEAAEAKIAEDARIEGERKAQEAADAKVKADAADAKKAADAKVKAEAAAAKKAADAAAKKETLKKV